MASLSIVQTPSSASSGTAPATTAGLSSNAASDAFLAVLGSMMGPMMGTMAGPASDEASADNRAEDPGYGDGSAGLVAPDLLVAGMAAPASPPPAVPGDTGPLPAGAAEAPDADGIPLAAAPSPSDTEAPGGRMPEGAVPPPGHEAGDLEPGDLEPGELEPGELELAALPDMGEPGDALREGDGEAATRHPDLRADGIGAATGERAVTRNAAPTPSPAGTVPAGMETTPAAPAVSGDGPHDASDARSATADWTGTGPRPTDESVADGGVADETAADRETSRTSPETTAFADERDNDSRGERRSPRDPDGRSERELRTVNVLRDETAETDAAPAGRERQETAGVPPAGNAGAEPGDAAPPARAQPASAAPAPADTAEAPMTALPGTDAGDGVVLTPIGGRAPGPEGASAGLPPQPPAGHGGQGAAGQSHPASEMVGVTLSRMADGRADRMTIQLRPAELGSVEVRLEFGQDGTVQARIIAERPEALDLLQRDSKALEKSLQDAGFQTGSGSLSFDLRGGQQGERNLAGFRQAFGKARSRDAAAASNADAIRQMTFVATPGRTTDPGRVDLRI